ncbi:hypothetical protein LEP1GSC043_1698 [Leptospira weilii str. Ecochallenge]|uniref:Uncharacterized protein n=1 Tax=Leptospira weilii str. Ecochallenge TaxID=1049986 RepID=N1U9Z4_9LEPT|nr:hypothetical protein LEP1GSC043_1698 [Leptospira weilii str. Ecochallenge]
MITTCLKILREISYDHSINSQLKHCSSSGLRLLMWIYGLRTDFIVRFSREFSHSKVLLIL